MFIFVRKKYSAALCETVFLCIFFHKIILKYDQSCFDLVVVADNHGLLDYSIKLLFSLLGDYWTLPHIHTSSVLGFITIEGSFSIVL
jgi:hypothetical protein